MADANVAPADDPARSPSPSRDADVTAWDDAQDDDQATGHASRPTSPPTDTKPSQRQRAPGRTAHFADDHDDDGMATTPPPKRSRRTKKPTAAAERAIRKARALAQAASRSVTIAPSSTLTPSRRAPAPSAKTPPPRFSASSPASLSQLPPLDRRFVARLTAPDAGWARRVEEERAAPRTGFDSPPHDSPLRLARTRQEFTAALRNEAQRVREDLRAVRIAGTQRLRAAAAIAHEELDIRHEIDRQERAGLNAIYRKFAEATLVLKTIESGKLAAPTSSLSGPSTTNGERFLRRPTIDAFRPAPSCYANVTTATSSVYAKASKAALGPTVSLLHRASYNHPLPPASTVDVLPEMLPYEARLCTVRERIEREGIVYSEADARACMVHNFHSVGAIYEEIGNIGQVSLSPHKQKALQRQQQGGGDAKKPAGRKRRMTLLHSMRMNASASTHAGEPDADSGRKKQAKAGDDKEPTDDAPKPSAEDDKPPEEATTQEADNTQEEQDSPEQQPGPTDTPRGDDDDAQPSAEENPAEEAEETTAAADLMSEPSVSEPPPPRAITLRLDDATPEHFIGAIGVRAGATVDEALDLAPVNALLAADAVAVCCPAAKATAAAPSDASPSDSMTASPTGDAPALPTVSADEAASDDNDTNKKKNAAAKPKKAKLRKWVRCASRDADDTDASVTPALSLRVAAHEATADSAAVVFDVALADAMLHAARTGSEEEAPVLPAARIEVAPVSGSAAPHVDPSNVSVGLRFPKKTKGAKAGQAAAQLVVTVGFLKPGDDKSADSTAGWAPLAPAAVLVRVAPSRADDAGEPAFAVSPWQSVPIPPMHWLSDVRDEPSPPPSGRGTDDGARPSTASATVAGLEDPRAARDSLAGVLAAHFHFATSAAAQDGTHRLRGMLGALGVVVRVGLAPNADDDALVLVAVELPAGHRQLARVFVRSLSAMLKRAQRFGHGALFVAAANESARTSFVQ